MRYNSVPNDVIYAHSHGTPVNTLTEMGLIGLIAGVILLSAAVINLWRRMKSGQLKTQLTAQLAISALVAVFVHSIFDCFHLEPGGLWILFILIAIPLSFVSNLNENKIRRPWWILVPIILMIVSIWMKSPYQQGVIAANSNQWQSAADQFEKSVKRDPWLAINHQQLGISYAVLAQENANRISAKGN